MPPRFRAWDSLEKAERRALPAEVCDRARNLQPVLNAYVDLCGGAPKAVTGPLDGLPYAAKDIFVTPDRHPLCGLALPPGVEGTHAEAPRLLDEAGAVRAGYTALTEIAYEPSGYNAVTGRVRNPWNVDFISGGSSSGSAAAVASGSAVIALGSDTGGSLRIPAHACGVTAWKPTYRAVPASGAMPLAPTLDTIGLLARGAADLAPAAHALAPALRAAPPAARAVVLRDLLDEAHPSVRKACDQGIEALAAAGTGIAAGAGRALLDACDAPVFTIMQAEAARRHRALLNGGDIGPVLRKRLVKGLEIDDVTLADAVAQRSRLAHAFAELLGEADVAILPVMAIRTPRAAECDPADASFNPRTLYELSRFTRFVNMTGLPAVAVPVAFDDRALPVALQLVGRAGSDLQLIALASAMQAQTDWHGRVPDAIASELIARNAPDIAR